MSVFEIILMGLKKVSWRFFSLQCSGKCVRLEEFLIKQYSILVNLSNDSTNKFILVFDLKFWFWNLILLIFVATSSLLILFD